MLSRLTQEHVAANQTYKTSKPTSKYVHVHIYIMLYINKYRKNMSSDSVTYAWISQDQRRDPAVSGPFLPRLCSRGGSQNSASIARQELQVAQGIV